MLRSILLVAGLLVAGTASAWPMTWIPASGGGIKPGDVYAQVGIEYVDGVARTMRDANGEPVMVMREANELEYSTTPIVPGYWMPSPYPSDIDKLIGGEQGCRHYNASWQSVWPTYFSWVPVAHH